MRWICTFGNTLAPVAAAFALLITVALAQQPAVPAPPSQPAKAAVTLPAAPKAEAKATEALDKAAASVDPKNTGWQEITLWERVQTQGVSYQSEGRYLAGPGQHMRLDLRVQVGKTAGERTVVSDGREIWNSAKVGSSPAQVTRIDLTRINAMLDSPGTPPLLREQFYRSQSFVGLVALLDSLRKQMVFTKLEKDRWQNHDVLKLTGVWSEEVSKSISPPPGSWPVSVPRTCRCYLDASTHWPYRIEWWGPVVPDGEDTLLTQIEFRDPKFVKGTGDTPPKDMLLAFKFTAGQAPVVDQTQKVLSDLNNQRAQLAQPPVPAPAPAPAAVPAPAKTPASKAVPK